MWFDEYFILHDRIYFINYSFLHHFYLTFIPYCMKRTDLFFLSDFIKDL